MALLDLLDQSAVAKLLASMTGGANMPQPQSSPTYGPMQGAMPQGSLLGGPQAGPTPPFNPNAGQGRVGRINGVRTWTQSEMEQESRRQADADAAHEHRKGLLGWARHATGADRISPELESLLTPDQQKRVKPSLARTLWGYVAEGRGPESIAQERAKGMTDLADFKTKRDAWATIQAKAAQITDPQARLNYVAQAATAAGLPQGPDAAQASNALETARPPAPRAPITKNTAEGIQQYNLETGQWEAMLDADGKPAMPFAPPVTPAYNIPSNVVGTTGKPVVFNSKTGKFEEQPDLAQAPPRSAALARAVGGIGQGYEARLMTAANEAPFILKRMREFEAERMKNGKFTLPLGSAAAAQIQASAQRGDAVGAMTQEMAGRLGDSSVNQYFADAARTARLMQLISARGGSEAMVGQESRLFRSQVGDDAAKVLAAKQARETMVGEFGALMQVMTPEQKRKLALGLAAIESGKDVVDLGEGQTISLPDLSREIFSTSPASPGGAKPGPEKSETREEMWNRLTKSGMSPSEATAAVLKAKPK